jgi:hypothetical protein
VGKGTWKFAGGSLSNLRQDFDGVGGRNWLARFSNEKCGPNADAKCSAQAHLTKFGQANAQPLVEM